ncbi:MAG: DUF480 domain-containing protein [Planctomycetota bacterium]
MAITLNPIELRVLGVLIEKSLANPASYPMTLNAITAGSNQKTNRDPVMSSTEGEVAAALHQLQQWQLVGQSPPDRGSRANRFNHDVEARFGWNAAQRAIMAELMLRGPQTLGELRGRASRMTHIESTDYARELLEELRRADPPAVVELPRQVGKSSTRWARLFGGDLTSATTAENGGGDGVIAAPTLRPDDPASKVPSVEARLDALEQEVIALRLDLVRLGEKPDTREDHP